MFIGNAEVPDELYVVLVENDAGIYSEHAARGVPISWEHCLTHATLDAAIMAQIRIGKQYGATRIAKLTLIDEEKPL
jgi:hypothetical protein